MLFLRSSSSDSELLLEDAEDDELERFAILAFSFAKNFLMAARFLASIASSSSSLELSESELESASESELEPSSELSFFLLLLDLDLAGLSSGSCFTLTTDDLTRGFLSSSSLDEAAEAGSSLILR